MRRVIVAYCCSVTVLVGCSSDGGGTSNTGGMSNSGGMSNTGATSNSGGSLATGGSSPTGGSSTAGTPGSGGATMGGRSGSGGAASGGRASGGALGQGGSGTAGAPTSPMGPVDTCNGDACPSGECDNGGFFSDTKCTDVYSAPVDQHSTFCADDGGYCLTTITNVLTRWAIACSAGTPTFHWCQGGCMVAGKSATCQ